MNIKIKISKKHALEIIKQFENDPNYYSHKSNDDFYFSFAGKKIPIIITIYKTSKNYFLEINLLS
jgi:hypothetical protein